MYRSKSTARRARPFSRALALAAGVLALLLPAGCDNPGCVFGGNCFDDDDGPTIGTNPASVPNEGETILPGLPTVTRQFPTGTGVDTRTPIVVVFSEAMSPQNLNIAFTLGATVGGFGDVPFATTQIGDGRVLILLPTIALQANVTYELRYREMVEFQDVTGQELSPPTDLLIGSFTTAATPTTAPAVVMIWPLDDAVQQSPTSEIDVVFDRPIDGSSVGNDSFVVTVEGDPPTFENELEPLSIGTTGLFDTRVWRYHSVDAQGDRASLGTAVDIALTLSPAGHPIEDTTNASLPTTTVGFTTLAFSGPTSASITSAPDDAIGINQLQSPPADLAIRVDFVDAAAGDVLEVYLFGTKQDEPQEPPLVAFLREAPLVDPFTSFTLTAAEIDLLLSSSPLKARVADGPVAFAFQVRRGSLRSPVKVLDVDPETDGIQLPNLDTVAPELFGLSSSGNIVSSFRSDLRDVALVGRASEALRAALVTTTLGDNTPNVNVPPVVAGAHSEGLFVAAPVEIGIVPPGSLPLTYTLTLYDKAFNSTAPVTGQFTQIGASGPGAPLSGGPIAVSVFDANSLRPIAGAIVTTHGNVAGTVGFVATETTVSSGDATILSAGTGETILTVDATAAGYGLFTLDGVATDRLGVPLHPDVLSDATTSGLIAATNDEITSYTRTISDSRTKETAEKLFPVGLCSFDQVDARIECPFAPVAIRPLQIGAQSTVAVLIPANLFDYSALTFFKGYELEMPLPRVAPTAAFENTITLPFLLDDPGLDPEERPIDVPAHVLSTAAYPSFTGNPSITVESTSPGLRGAVVVGRGVAFEDTLQQDSWAVRAAYPGAVDGIIDVPGDDDLGRLVTSKTIAADLRLRAEVSEPGGNRAGARPRLSQTTLVLAPPPAAQLDANPAVVNPGGVSFDLVFTDVLPDAAGVPGLYRVVIDDVNGRRWSLWRVDRPDADGPNVVLHVPYVGRGGTLPLAPGTLRAQISLFAWPDFVPGEFLWTDVEREHDLYSHALPVPFTPP